jgi:hypothetical protein
LTFRRSSTPKGTSRACGDHVCVIWLKSVKHFFGICSENDMTSYNLLLRSSFDIQGVVHKRHIYGRHYDDYTLRAKFARGVIQRQCVVIEYKSPKSSFKILQLKIACCKAHATISNNKLCSKYKLHTDKRIAPPRVLNKQTNMMSDSNPVYNTGDLHFI